MRERTTLTRQLTRAGRIGGVQRLLVTAAATLALLLGGTVPAEATNRPLRVMTRNLYLGADLTPALQAKTTPEFLGAVVGIYGSSRATKFTVRAAAIADQIEDNRPDLVGLQEVTSWQTSGPANIAPSEDFLVVLQRALDARGLRYRVAAESVNAKIGPVPLVAPCGSTTVGACLLTFIDRDIVLVNKNTRQLRWSNPQSGNFAAQVSFTPPVPGAASVSFNRGWASIDGRFRGQRFHFVTTHLETQGFPAEQQAQAAELLAGPAYGPGTDLLVGDINSAGDRSTTPTYGLLTEEFRDVWSRRRGPGYTCCQDSTLANPVSTLSQRIDVILVHRGRPGRAWVVGDEPIAATPPLWASDHAGVVAEVRLR